MKFFKLLFLCMFIVNHCFADNRDKFTIIGALPDSMNNIYVYLTPLKYLDDDNQADKTDSALVKKGRFRLKGTVDQQNNLYQIWSSEYPAINGSIVLEAGEIQYKYQADGVKGYAYAKGTYLNNWMSDSIIFPSMQIAKYGEMLMRKEIDRADPQMADKMQEMRNNAMSFYQNIISFVKANGKQPVGEYVFLMYAQSLKEKDLKDILPVLSENVRQKYEEQKNPLNIPKITVGQQYIPFKGKTTDNKYLNIADIVKTKKVVLLDFWASWCAPCLQEMPRLRQLYENYKDKGLEIVGISSDEHEIRWKKAIEKYKMSWIQIISAKDTDNIAKMYGINQIPHTILINNEGKIISVNISGEELTEKINTLLQ